MKKQTKHILLVFFVFLLFLLMCGCKNQAPKSALIYTVYDATDDSRVGSELLFDAADVLAVIGAKPNSMMEVQWKNTVLSDVTFNKSDFIHITSGTAAATNPHMRQIAWKEFAGGMDIILQTTFEQSEKGKKKTQLYYPLCTLLGEMAADPSERKLIVIQSNMVENSHILSFLGRFDELEEHPEKMRAKLQSQCTLPDLMGIEIYILWNPQTPEQDQRFFASASFFADWFSERGATVKIGANL